MKQFPLDNKTFIIAEAGVNHNGRMSLAKKLVDAAAACGCDAVKFQTFKTENLVSRQAHLAEYQKMSRSNKARNQFELIKKLELGFADFKELKNYCDTRGIMFLSTPFDFESVDLLMKLNIPLFKVPSGEVTNLPFLEYIAAKAKPMILSTGMSTLKEVAEAVKTILTTQKELTLLHCVTEYPAPYDEINLRAMDTLRKAFHLPVGYSDHSPGIEVALAAAAREALVIEKHLTLDRSLPGPDHQSSLEPKEFGTMVRCIRNIEQSLGDGVKKPAACEMKNIPIVRKSLVAQKAILKGKRITRQDIAIKRPGYGIPPEKIDKIIGMKVRFNINIDHVLVWEDLQ